MKTKTNLLVALILLATLMPGSAQSPPTLVSAGSINGNDIGVCFSREMSLIGLTTPSNYQVSAGGRTIPITSVSLWPGNISVVLHLSVSVSGAFTVSAQGLRDLASNFLADDSTVTGRVGNAALAVAEIGTPSPAAEFLSCQEGRVTMRSGGNLFSSDVGPSNFDYLYGTRTNDFDVQVRLDSLVKNASLDGVGLESPFVALGGLMVRSSLDPSSPSLALIAMPTNGFGFIVWRTLRPANDAPQEHIWGSSAEGFPLWLRIRRSESSFASYLSTNATDWTQIGEPQTLRGASAVMQVGLITISFSDGVYATAEYRDFGDTPLNPNALVQVTQQPADVTVEANHSATFTALARVSGAAQRDLIYEWQAETVPGSGVFTNVFFGASPRYTTPALSVSDSGLRVRLTARISGGPRAVSAAAAVTVVPDVTPPRVLSATARKDWSEINLAFSERVERSDAEDLFSYSGSDFGVAGASLDASGRRVTLTLNGPLDLGVTHELSVMGIRDLAGRILQPNPTTVTVTAAMPQRGAALQELYLDIAGTALAALRSDAKFPDAPDITTPVAQLEGPINFSDNYGTRISGMLIPPVSGHYHFWMSSDDEGEFWLSTDDSPANRVLLCREPSWNGFRNYNGLDRRDPVAPENRSASLFPEGISLVADHFYYFEALSKEGQGDDHVSVAWQSPGGAAPLDGGPPIPGAYLALLGDPVDATIEIDRQPSNVVSVQVGSASDNPHLLLSEDFDVNDGGFTTQQAGNPLGPWVYDAAAGVWSTDGTDNLPPAEKLLTSPRFTVTEWGEVRLSFQHRFNFEEGSWDGGQLRVRVNSAPFTAVPTLAFISNGYTGAITGVGPLFRLPGFVNTSPGYADGEYLTSVARLGVFKPGDTLAIQFRGSWDWNTVGLRPNWVIDRLALTEGHPGSSIATFSVQATAVRSDDGAAPLAFAWQRDCGASFADIPGANEAVYSFIPSASDHGCRYRCLLYTLGASATSQVATLTVALPPLTVTRDGDGLTLLWDTGVLQQADTVNGPWHDVPQAISPAHVAITDSKRFYRLRSP